MRTDEQLHRTGSYLYCAFACNGQTGLLSVKKCQQPPELPDRMHARLIDSA